MRYSMTMNICFLDSKKKIGSVNADNIDFNYLNTHIKRMILRVGKYLNGI